MLENSFKDFSIKVENESLSLLFSLNNVAKEHTVLVFFQRESFLFRADDIRIQINWQVVGEELGKFGLGPFGTGFVDRQVL